MGLSDVLLQNWAAGFGPLAFIAVVSWMVAGYSIVQALVRESPLPRFPKESRCFVWTSNLLLAVQGLMMAIALAMQMMIEPGDEVVVVGPVWPNIYSTIELNEGVATHATVRLTDEN